MKDPRTAQVLLAKNKLGWSMEVICSQFSITELEYRAIVAAEEGIKEALGDLQTPEQVTAGLRNLAVSSDSPKVQLEALKYLHAEMTGRNDIPRLTLELKKQKLQLEAVNVGLKLDQFNSSVLRARNRVAAIELPKAPAAELTEAV